MWLRDGSGFIYSANDENPNDFHLYRYDLASKKATRLYAAEGTWSADDVTNDGKRVLVSHPLSASDAQVYELDVASSKLTDLTLKPEGSTAACEIIGYLPDEKSVLCPRTQKDGRQRLFVRPLKQARLPSRFRRSPPSSWTARRQRHARPLVAVANQDSCGVTSVTRCRTSASARAHQREGHRHPTSLRGRR